MRPRGADPFKVGAIVLSLLVVLVYLGFAKDVPFVNEPYEIRAAFRDSSGIKAGSPVRIAGVEVGKVSGVQHTSPGARSATVTMAIDDAARPVHADARAKIRPRIFLEGNFFVDLSPGTSERGELDDGETIPAERTSNPVQLDEVLKALQSDTREDLQRIFVELDRTHALGGAEAFNDSLPDQTAAYRTAAIVSEALLGRRPTDLGDWIRDQGAVSAALTRDRRALRDLVTSFATTARVFAEEERHLRATLRELGPALDAAMPAFDALNASFPNVRRFAAATLPALRSTDVTVDDLLPLVRQLRGLVGRRELRGLARDLAGAAPGLTRVAQTSVPLLEQLRLLSSCTTGVLAPWGDDTVADENFPAVGPVHQEFPKSLVGLAGESRSFDANGQWFKVLGSGGLETISLGNGLVGSAASPLVGVNPPAQRTRPPLRPETPCETQERPDLRTIPGAPPRSLDAKPGSAAARARTAKARAVAIDHQRRALRARGDDTKVLDRDATAADIEALARGLGLSGQLRRLTRKAAEAGR